MDQAGFDPGELGEAGGPAAGPATAYALATPFLAPMAAYAMAPSTNESYPPAAPGPNPLPWCHKGQFDCLNVRLTGNAIVTALWVSAIAGFVFLLVFGIFRGRIQVFTTRLDLPSVWNRPPHLPQGGFHQLWSWLVPVIAITDLELMHTAGMDSLMLNWTNSLGIQIFGPLTIFGMAALLPINLTGNRIRARPPDKPAEVSTSTFARLTISNIKKGSQAYWAAFAFLFLATAYVCWLLMKYYKCYVVLRQSYLQNSEQQVNEWHRQFLEKRAAQQQGAGDKDDRASTRSVRSMRSGWMKDAVNNLNPNRQMDCIEEGLEDVISIGHGNRGQSNMAWRRLEGGRARARLQGLTMSQTMGPREHLPTPYPYAHASIFRSPLAYASGPIVGPQDGALTVPRVSGNGTALSPLRLGVQPEEESSTAVSPDRAASEPAASPPWRANGAAPDAAPAAHAGMQRSASDHRQRRHGGERYSTLELLSPGHLAGHPLPIVPERGADTSGCIGEFLERSASPPVAPAKAPASGAGAPSSAIQRAQSAHEARGGGSARGSLEGMRTFSASSRNGASWAMERESVVSISTDLGDAPPNARISAFETNPPPDDCQGCERVHRWWATKEMEDGRQMMGKPSVLFRKTVNVEHEDGSQEAVNAQLYTVLVMDVPNLRRQHERLVQRAAQRSWAARAWAWLSLGFQQHVLMRRNVAGPATRRSGHLLKRSARKAHASDGALAGRDAPADAPDPKLTRTNGAAADGGAKGIGGARPVADITADAARLARRQSSGGGGGVAALSGETGRLQGRGGMRDMAHDIEMGAAVVVPSSASSARSSATTMDLPLLLQQEETSASLAEPEQPAMPEAARRSPFQRPSLQLESMSEDSAEGAAVPSPYQAAMMADGESSLSSPLDPQELVHTTFQTLFPNGYHSLLPVRKHREVELLLHLWDKAWEGLAHAEARYEQGGRRKRPRHTIGARCGCIGGQKVDSIDYWAAKVHELEAAIVRARKTALAAPPCASYFVFFNNQADAAIAAQVNLHPEDGHSFHVVEAPGPEEVNWPTLWLSWREREVREMLVLPLIIGIMLIPVGLFSGAVAQITVAICGGGPGPANRLYSEWYCLRHSLGQKLITSMVPTILLVLWQNLVMPNVFYRFALMEGKWPSLSLLDRRICSLFFYWSTWNVFLGAMLGGSAFSQLGVVIANPSTIINTIGTALPSSSNFFVTYVLIQAVAMIPFRLMYPHIGSLIGLFRLCGYCKPVHKRQKMAAVWPHSIRHGREVATIMLIYIMALAYAPSSPLILPFALAYFAMSWTFWRYNMMFISERCYESGGTLWDLVFDQICWCLFIMEFFTGCIFLANAAYVQATLTWCLLTPFLYKFNRYCKVRFGMAVKSMPLETAARAPEAVVDHLLYTPPALRPGAAGWYPEYGKAWESWNAPPHLGR